MTPRRPAYWLLALTLTIAPIGCSKALDDLPRVPVAGTVTMDGQPLPEAIIQFSPTGDATKARAAGAIGEIKDGTFSIPREDGPTPGPHKVSISHAELKEAKVKGKAKVNTSIPSRNKQLGPELIPARYNTQSELKADINPGGNTGLKYDLKSR